MQSTENAAFHTPSTKGIPDANPHTHTHTNTRFLATRVVLQEKASPAPSFFSSFTHVLGSHGGCSASWPHPLSMSADTESTHYPSTHTHTHTDKTHTHTRVHFHLSQSLIRTPLSARHCSPRLRHCVLWDCCRASQNSTKKVVTAKAAATAVVVSERVRTCVRVCVCML